MTGQQRVVCGRLDQRRWRIKQFGPHYQHRQTSPSERDHGIDPIQYADILVIYGGQPSSNSTWLLLVAVLCMPGTTPNVARWHIRADIFEPSQPGYDRYENESHRDGQCN